MRRLVGFAVVALAACSIPVAEQPAEKDASSIHSITVPEPEGRMTLPGSRPDRPIYFPPTPDEVAAARARVRRLRPAEFPELPSSIADTLDAMGCLVPQTASAGPLENVVRGEFFESGKTGWAVVCSIGEMVRILAFRHDGDTAPELVVEHEEDVCLGGEWNCGALFGTSVSAVGREYIERRYEAYGGPKPPPIDHEGINQGIWDKGSIVHYYYEGRWLRLTGAD